MIEVAQKTETGKICCGKQWGNHGVYFMEWNKKDYADAIWRLKSNQVLLFLVLLSLKIREFGIPWKTGDSSFSSVNVSFPKACEIFNSLESMTEAVTYWYFAADQSDIIIYDKSTSSFLACSFFSNENTKENKGFPVVFIWLCQIRILPAAVFSKCVS